MLRTPAGGRLLPPEERRFKPPTRAPIQPRANKSAKPGEDQTLRVGINMPDGSLVCCPWIRCALSWILWCSQKKGRVAPSDTIGSLAARLKLPPEASFSLMGELFQCSEG